MNSSSFSSYLPNKKTIQGAGLNLPNRGAETNNLVDAQTTARQLLFKVVKEKSQVQMQVDEIALEAIDLNPAQPRKYFDPVKLEELKQSIQQQGLIQPIVVTPRGIGRWMLVAGERRYRACRALGYNFIACRKIYNIDDTKALEIAILENLARDDLTPIEEARIYKTLIDEHGYTQEQFGEILGRSQDTISSLLRLLSLPAEIQELLTTRVVNYAQAREIAKLRKPEHQKEVTEAIVRDKLTSRQVGEQVRQIRARERGQGALTILAGEISGTDLLATEPKMRVAEGKSTDGYSVEGSKDRATLGGFGSEKPESSFPASCSEGTQDRIISASSTGKPKKEHRTWQMGTLKVARLLAAMGKEEIELSVLREALNEDLAMIEREIGNNNNGKIGQKERHK